MKKLVIFFALVVVMCFSAKAQIANEDQQQLEAFKAAANQEVDKDLPWVDETHAFVGNDPEAIVLRSRHINTTYLGVTAGVNLTDEFFSPTIGGEFGYQGKHWCFALVGQYMRGRSYKASDVERKYDVLAAGGRVSYTLLQTRNHHTGLRLYGYAGFETCFSSKTAEASFENEAGSGAASVEVARTAFYGTAKGGLEVFYRPRMSRLLVTGRVGAGFSNRPDYTGHRYEGGTQKVLALEASVTVGWKLSSGHKKATKAASMFH